MALDDSLGRREFAKSVGGLAAFGAQETTEGEKQPTPRWTATVAPDERIRVIEVAHGNVYVESGPNLYALSAADGSRRWEATPEPGDASGVGLAETGPDTAYLRTDRGTVAVDAKTGDERWRGASANGIVPAGDIVYLAGSDLTARRTRDGAVQWQTTPGSGAVGLRADENSLYVTAGRDSRPIVRAYGREDGHERWQYEANESGWLAFVGGYFSWETGDSTQRVVADDTLFVLLEYGRREHRLVALSTDDGTARWWFDREQLAATVGDGVVVTAEPTVRAFEPQSGETRWTYQPDAERIDRIEVRDGRVYVETAERLVVLGAESGEVEWEFRLSSGTLSEISEDIVAIGSPEGPHYALAPGDGSRFWQFRPHDHPPRKAVEAESVTWYPQVADGSVYMGTDTGTVYAVGVPGARSLLDTLVEPFGGRVPALFVGAAIGGAALLGGYRHFRTKDRTPAAKPMPTALDGFEPLRTLGAGPTGVVHAATWEGGGDRTVALKRLDSNPDGFEDAMEAWAELDDNEGIVTVFDWGTDPQPWVAMEHVPSGSLDATLRALSVDAGLEFVVATAEAVHAAHKEDVVHGHLHPRNVLLRDGRECPATIGDWRLAALSDHPTDAAHLAPEQRKGGDADARTDVFQLGALAYQVCTGRGPYGDGFETEPTPPSEMHPDASRELDDVILRALAVDPGERYETALAFADMLRWAAFVR